MPGNPPSTALLAFESNGFHLENLRGWLYSFLFSLSLARREGILVLGHGPAVLSPAHLQPEGLENLTGPR